jgi:predicted nucleic acid-binding protein
MARRIFIDTSAFLALEDSSDEHHEEALRFRDQELLSGDYELITTSYILDETLTVIRSRLGISASIEFSKKIRQSQVLRILPISREIEEKALDLFEKYDDKTFSFTDCVSFVMMRDLEISEAFAFDRHFQQMGFRTVPESE